MSVKVHFLHSHLSYFPVNLGALGEEDGKRFHQDIETMERRYQRRMADYLACPWEWDSHGNPMGNVPWDGTARIAFPMGPMRQ